MPLNISPDQVVLLQNHSLLEVHLNLSYSTLGELDQPLIQIIDGWLKSLKHVNYKLKLE